MRIHIPESIEAAKQELTGLSTLLTAKQWERAAIVYAFTRSEMGRGDKLASSSDIRLPVARFAALNLTGLGSQDSVRLYRKAWQSAIDDGQATEVRPGDDIELPLIPWKEAFGQPTRDVQARQFRMVAKDPDLFREALRDEPEAIVALAHRVTETPAVRAQIEIKERQKLIESLPREPQRPDYSAEFRGAAHRLLRCLEAMRAGQWEPDELERTLAHFMASAWTEAAGEQPTYSVIDEIQAFLATTAQEV